MTKREHRDTANDIFRNSQHTFYPNKVSFEEAYPEIEDIQIEVNETGEGIYEKSGSRSYRKKIFWDHSLIVAIIRHAMAVGSRLIPSSGG